MPLDAIQALLHAPTSAAMEALLHEHQQRIADRIAKDQQALHLLQRLIDHQADDLAFSVQVKQLPAQSAGQHHACARRLPRRPARSRR